MNAPIHLLYLLHMPEGGLDSCNKGSVMAIQTLLLSNMLTAWRSSKLEQLEHQLQALVTLAQRQVHIGADSAQGVQQRRQQRLQSVTDLCSESIPLRVHTQQNGPGQLVGLSGVG